MRALIGVLLVSAAAHGSALSAQPPGLRQIELLMQQMVSDSGVPALSAAVIHHGVSWEFGAGTAMGRAVTAATPLPTASVTKLFTATALMQLEGAGRLRLDDPISRHVRRAIYGVPGDPSIADVARHLGGFPGYFRFFYLDRAEQPEPLDSMIARFGFLMATPGERYNYSNLGYGVLQRVIETTSGVPYHEYVRAHVFDPLRLDSAFVLNRGSAARVSGFQGRNRLGQLSNAFTVEHEAASSAWLSARELSRFGASFLPRAQPPLLPAAAVQRMFALKPGSPSPHGIGWQIGDRFGWREISHGGWMPGTDAGLYIYPDQDLVIAVIATYSAPGARSQASHLRNAILRQLGASPANAAPTAAPAATSKPPASVAGTWIGSAQHGASAVPLRLQITDGNTIQVQLGSAQPAAARSVSVAGNLVTGRFDGGINVPGLPAEAVMLLFELAATESSLVGELRMWTPGAVDRFLLPLFVRLQRE